MEISFSKRRIWSNLIFTNDKLLRFNAFERQKLRAGRIIPKCNYEHNNNNNMCYRAWRKDIAQQLSRLR